MTSYFKLSLSALLGSSALVTMPVLANEVQDAANASQSYDDGGIEDIVVTAQRRSESAQRTPLAITAIGGGALSSAGVLETSDLGAVVPNMQIISPFGRSQPNISVRGISVANEYNPNQASPIGIYVDDAYLPSRTSHGQQLYDLERVEVLRGPQGTLYGRNTTGGAVNFITMRPQLDDSSGNMEFGYGNNQHMETSGVFNKVIVPGTLAVRGAFNWVRSDGMVSTVHGGRDVQSEDSLGGRISLLAKPNDDLTIFLKFYSGRDQPIGNGNITIGTGPDGANGVTGYNSTDFGKYESGATDMGRFRFRASGALANISYSFGDWTLTSNTSYDWGGRNLYHDTDNSPYKVLQINWVDNFKDINQEIRLNYESDQFKLLIGGYYGWDEVSADNRYEYFHFLDGIAPFDPNLENSGFGIRSRYTQVRRSKAMFGQAEYDLTDKFSVAVGLRYTWDSLAYKNGNANVLDYDNQPVYNTVPFAGAPYDPDVFLNRSKNFRALSGKLSLNYQFSSNVLAYVSYSRGYRAGAVNAAGYLSPDQVTFVDPEKVDAFEGGVKSDLLGNRLRINLSGFYYLYKNQQLQEIVGPLGFLRSAPRSTIYGLEAEVTARVTRDFQINGTLGLLSTEYNSLELSGLTLDGNRLPFAPKVTAGLGMDWTFARLDRGGNFVANANVSYNSQQWFSPFNGMQSFSGDSFDNRNQQQGAYALVNAKISYDSETLFASIWAKNLLHKQYSVYGIDLRSTFGYDYLAYGSPRTYGATLGFKF